MEKKFGMTGTWLKLIAVTTMFIDHIGAGIIEIWLYGNWYSFPEDYRQKMEMVDGVLRAIGRIAFPIFCYMLVEGFLHTRNVKKYGLRLFVVGLISEIPFDYLFANDIFNLYHNNVMWELLLGLLVLNSISYVEQLNINNKVKNLQIMLVLLVGMLIGYFTALDYGAGGICCIAAMYMWNGTERIQRVKAFAVGVLVLVVTFGLKEAWAFLGLIPMYFYNGTRGADNKAIRLFFYLFYPVHIILLGLIAYSFYR